MTRPYRIVSPFIECVPEHFHHRTLPFDWRQSLQMLSHTARLSNHVPLTVLTNETTALPDSLEVLRLPTTHTRLTLWLLEIRLRYLSSEAFDRDTVTVDADELLFGSLAPWFDTKAGLVVLVRTTEKHMRPGGWPLMNGVQWWKVRRKAQLVAFYEEALRRAEQMSEEKIVWGSETDAVRELLDPLQDGRAVRYGGLLVDMVNVDDAMETFSGDHIHRLGQGDLTYPTRPILDFRWMRKQYIRGAYEALVLQGVSA